MNRHDKGWAYFKAKEPIFINIDAVMDGIIFVVAFLALGALL